MVRPQICSVRPGARDEVVQRGKESALPRCGPSTMRADSLRIVPHNGIYLPQPLQLRLSALRVARIRNDREGSLNILKVPKAVSEPQRGTNQEISAETPKPERTTNAPETQPANNDYFLGQNFFSMTQPPTYSDQHLGEMDFADFRKQLIGVKFREPYVVDPPTSSVKAHSQGVIHGG